MIADPVTGGPVHSVPRTRVHVGELISLMSALALLVVMFATAWYGVAGVPDPSAARPAISTAADAWTVLTVTRWILVATIALVLGSVALHATQRRHGARTDTGLLVAGFGTLSGGLLIWRVLVALPGSGRVIDQKLGAVLGLACALGIAWGGYEALREERSHRRRPGLAEVPGPTPGTPAA
jgi:hypothetical protein